MDTDSLNSKLNFIGDISLVYRASVKTYRNGLEDINKFLVQEEDV